MLKILILCTGNSCRSILGEALLNHLGTGRVQGFSAGSHPTGRVNPNALATLKRHGLPTDGLASKTWDEFADAGIDVAITVCDQAAGEACPVYLGAVVRAHWGLPDPARVTGTDEEVAAAFEAVFQGLQQRITAMLALPMETGSLLDLGIALQQIAIDYA